MFPRQLINVLKAKSMHIEQNQQNEDQSFILSLYGLTQIVVFCLILAMIGFAVNQTFNSLLQVKEINFLNLQHLKLIKSR